MNLYYYFLIYLPAERRCECHTGTKAIEAKTTAERRERKGAYPATDRHDSVANVSNEHRAKRLASGAS